MEFLLKLSFSFTIFFFFASVIALCSRSRYIFDWRDIFAQVLSVLTIASLASTFILAVWVGA